MKERREKEKAEKAQKEARRIMRQSNLQNSQAQIAQAAFSAVDEGESAKWDGSQNLLHRGSTDDTSRNFRNPADLPRRLSKESKESVASDSRLDSIDSFQGSKRGFLLGSNDGARLSLSQINEEKLKQRRAQESEASCVRRVSVELNCPHDTVQDARNLFIQYAGTNADGIACLDFKAFSKIVVHLMDAAGIKLPDSDMQKKIKVSWHEAD